MEQAYERIYRQQYSDDLGSLAFDGESIESDYENYHLALRRMHHAHLHGDGVAGGLQVTAKLGENVLSVYPGIAIDTKGKLIVLADEDLDDSGESEDPPGWHDVPVRLSTASFAGSKVYVTIHNAEVNEDNRFLNVPMLRLQPADGFNDDLAVILAVAEIDAAGNVANLRERDESLPYGRQVIDITAHEVQIARPVRTEESAGGGAGTEVVVRNVAPAGVIGPGPNGGLRLAVPSPDDTIVFEENGGDSFARMTVRSDKLEATGDVEVKGQVESAGLNVAGDATVAGNLQSGEITAATMLRTKNLQVDASASVGGTGGLILIYRNVITTRRLAGRPDLYLLPGQGDLVVHSEGFNGAVPFIIKERGNVGIGHNNPAPRAQLHVIGKNRVRGSVDGGFLVLGSNAGNNLALDDIQIQARHKDQNATLYLQPLGGDLIVREARCDGNKWHDASSVMLKQDVDALDLQDALDTLDGLEPIVFRYKDDASNRLQAGFIAEHVPNLVATEDRKHLSALEIVSVLTKVVQSQQREIQELKARLEA